MKTIRPKPHIKKAILKQCIIQQQAFIDDFRDRLKMIEYSLETEKEKPENGNKISFSQSNYNSTYQSLDFAEAEMGILLYLNSKEYAKCLQVELGSVIITDKVSFYIAVNIGQFSAEGHTYIGISTHSPLFHAMYGKKVGEQFSFEGKDYLILDIY